MSDRLEQIEARLAEARRRSEGTLRDLPDNRLLSRAEHDRQRLIKDVAALLAVVEAVREIAASLALHEALRVQVSTSAISTRLAGALNGLEEES